MAHFQKFCQTYASRFSSDKSISREVGIEKEILVTDQLGEMANVGHTLWPHLQKQPNFEPVFGSFYKDELMGFKTPDGEITTDAGEGTLELILEPHETIKKAKVHMDALLRRVLSAAQMEGLHVLGLGYQPIASASEARWNRKQRYEVLVESLSPEVHAFTLGAADQAHIDITQDEFVPVTNMFLGLTGFMMALFSNSPLASGKKQAVHGCREIFWDSLGRDRTGIPEKPFESMEQYLDQVWDLDCILIKEGNCCRNPHKTFREHAETLDSDEAVFDAFALHEGAIWFSSRPRVFGTIEVRPACMQPWEDRMVLAAFALGATENWKALSDFLGQFEWQALRQLRYDVSHHGLQTRIKGKPITEFLIEILKLVEEGLENRREPEGNELKSLYERVESKQSPADRVWAIFDQEGLDGVLKKTSLTDKHLTSQ